jgi:transposase
LTLGLAGQSLKAIRSPRIDPGSRIPAEHPLRRVRSLVRAVLEDLSRSFTHLYSHEGRPSIPPEALLSALLLQVLYGIRRSDCR